MPRRSSSLVRIVLQLFAAAAVVALTVGLLSFRDYVRTSPRFCQACHEVAPEIAVWSESSHQDVRCRSCHHQSLRESLGILRLYLVSGSTAVGHAGVRVESCAGCHASHDDDWPTIAHSRGHRLHTGKAGLDCIACHGQQMHFAQPARGTCAACHPDVAGGSAHDEVHCLSCHDFLADEEVIRPSRGDCLDCHRRLELPVVLDETAPMQFACAACHHPHDDEERLVSCASCHRDRDLAGLHAIESHADCAACHEPHAWLSERHHCEGCHDGLATHYRDRTCSECHSFERGLKTGPR